MKYDLTLFKGTAKYYAKYRPGYTDSVFKLLVKDYKLDGKGRLLDLGTGTGQLAIPLAKYFEQVIAMDPDKEMLQEGRRQAKKAKVKNITWVQGSSETLGKNLGLFRLVVMGRSFHWMKRREVLKKLYGMVDKNGGVAIMADWGLRGSWNQIAKEVIKRYVGLIRRAGNRIYRKPPGLHQKIIANSPFRKWKEKYLPYKRTSTIDQIVNYHYSTSFASKFVLGKKAKTFDREFRKALIKFNPKGKFVEKGRTQVFLLHK